MIRALLLAAIAAGCGRIGFGEFGVSLDDATSPNDTTGATDAATCGVTAGLLGHWTLDAADIIGTMAVDSSGNGQHGTLNGAQPVISAGRIGDALDFGGPAVYAEMASLALDMTPGAFNSFSLWFFNDRANVDDGLFAVPQAAMPAPPRYDVWLNFDRIGEVSLCINTGGGDCWGISDPGLIGRWVHVVAVLVNGQMDGGQFYVDGVDVVETCRFAAGCTAVRSAMLPFRFGAGDPTYPWRGMIDDVRVYNRALTAAEAQQLYACAP